MFMKDLHLECMKMLPMCCWMVKGGHEVKTLILVFSFKFVLIRGIVTGKRWPSGTPLTSELRLPYKILRDPVPGTSRPSGFSHPTILATTLPHFAIWYLHTSTHDSLLRCSWECFPPPQLPLPLLLPCKYLLETQAYVSHPLKNLLQLDLGPHFEIPLDSADNGQPLTNFGQESDMFRPFWRVFKGSSLSSTSDNERGKVNRLVFSQLSGAQGRPPTMAGSLCRRLQQKKQFVKTKYTSKETCLSLPQFLFFRNPDGGPNQVPSLEAWAWVSVPPLTSPMVWANSLIRSVNPSPTTSSFKKTSLIPSFSEFSKSVDAKPIIKQLFLVLYPNHSREGSDHGKNSASFPRTSSFPNKRTSKSQQVSLISCCRFLSIKSILGGQRHPAHVSICLSYLISPHLLRLCPFIALVPYGNFHISKAPTGLWKAP